MHNRNLRTENRKPKLFGFCGGSFLLYLGLWNSPGGGGGQKEKLMCDRSLLIKHCLSNTDPTSIQREQKKTGRLEIPKYFRGLYKGDSDRVPNSLECLMELNLHQWRIVTQTVNGERYQRAREKREHHWSKQNLLSLASIYLSSASPVSGTEYVLCASLHTILLSQRITP